MSEKQKDRVEVLEEMIFDKAYNFKYNKNNGIDIEEICKDFNNLTEARSVDSVQADVRCFDCQKPTDISNRYQYVIKTGRVVNSVFEKIIVSPLCKDCFDKRNAPNRGICLTHEANVAVRRETPAAEGDAKNE